MIDRHIEEIVRRRHQFPPEEFVFQKEAPMTDSEKLPTPTDQPVMGEVERALERIADKLFADGDGHLNIWVNKFDLRVLLALATETAALKDVAARIANKIDEGSLGQGGPYAIHNLFVASGLLDELRAALKGQS